MKKIFALFCLLFLLFPIVSSNKINLASDGERQETGADDIIMLSLSSSSTPVQSIAFSISGELCDRAGLNALQRSEFIDCLLQKIDHLRTEFLLSLSLKYLQNPIEQYKINKGVTLTAVSYNDNSSLIGFSIIYDSHASFNYYNSSSSSSSSGDTQRGNYFIKKYISQGKFPFSSQFAGQNTTIGQRYKEIFLSAAEGKDYYQAISQNYSPKFVYDYAVVNDKLKSNANFITKSAEQTHHIWIVDEQNLTNANDIQLSLTMVNRGAWYLTALIVVMAVTIICIFIELKIRPKLKK